MTTLGWDLYVQVERVNATEILIYGNGNALKGPLQQHRDTQLGFILFPAPFTAEETESIVHIGGSLRVSGGLNIVIMDISITHCVKKVR